VSTQIFVSTIKINQKNRTANTVLSQVNPLYYFIKASFLFYGPETVGIAQLAGAPFIAAPFLPVVE